MAQSVGRCIDLLFHDHGTGRSSVQQHVPVQFTTGKEESLIVEEGGLDPGPVWRGGKSRSNGDSIPNRPDSSQSLYRLN